MRRFIYLFTLIVFMATVGRLLVHLRPVLAAPPPPSTQPPGTIYNPYPFGILPGDLVSEIARVRAEVAFIEAEAIAQWQALPPPILRRVSAGQQRRIEQFVARQRDCKMDRRCPYER